MDPFSIGFIVVLALVGGASAFFADWLGRKLAKKRLSYLRLRPKHFAALSVSIVGALFPILTVGLMAWFSHDIRDVLTKGRTAIRELDKKNIELGRMTKLVEQKTAEFEQERKKLEELRKEVPALQSQVTGLNSEVTTLKKQISNQKSKLSSVQKTLASARLSLASQKKEYGLLKADRDRLETQRKNLASQSKQLSIFKQNLEQQNIALDQNIQAMNLDIAKKQKEIDASVERVQKLDEALKEREQSIKVAEAQLSAKQDELNSANAKLDQAKADVLELQRIGTGFLRDLDKARKEPMIYSFGAEVTRFPVPANATRDDAQNALTTLLRTVRINAENLGAKGAPGQEAAGLLDRQEGPGRVITAQMQAEEAIKKVSGLDEPSVLIAYSVWNSFRGEYLWVSVEAFKNPLVFRQGQTVAETTIDGNRTKDAILTAIQEFLKVKVREAATRAKMIPAAGREQQFGSISNEKVLDLVEEIKGSRRQIRLLAVAVQDTRAADQLELDFRLR